MLVASNSSSWPISPPTISHPRSGAFLRTSRGRGKARSRLSKGLRIHPRISYFSESRSNWLAKVPVATNRGRHCCRWMSTSSKMSQSRLLDTQRNSFFLCGRRRGRSSRNRCRIQMPEL
jgi:hypothetical protein